MTTKLHAVRSIVFAGAVLSTPVLAQDRLAVFSGSGESAEVIYVSPADPRARTAYRTVQDDAKPPLLAVLGADGDGLGVTYHFEVPSATAYPSSSAFAVVPVAMRIEEAARGSALGTGPWSTGE